MRLRRFALKERRNKGTTDLLGVWLLVEGGFIWPETVPHTTMPYFLLLGMSRHLPLKSIFAKFITHLTNISLREIHITNGNYKLDVKNHT